MSISLFAFSWNEIKQNHKNYFVNRNRERLTKKFEEFQQMQKNADSKYDEIQSAMTETNKRRKQITVQLKKKEEELEELKRVRNSTHLLSSTQSN